MPNYIKSLGRDVDALAAGAIDFSFGLHRFNLQRALNLSLPWKFEKAE